MTNDRPVRGAGSSSSRCLAFTRPRFFLWGGVRVRPGRQLHNAVVTVTVTEHYHPIIIIVILLLDVGRIRRLIVRINLSSLNHRVGVHRTSFSASCTRFGRWVRGRDGDRIEDVKGARICVHRPPQVSIKQ